MSKMENVSPVTILISGTLTLINAKLAQKLMSITRKEEDVFVQTICHLTLVLSVFNV